MLRKVARLDDLRTSTRLQKQTPRSTNSSPLLVTTKCRHSRGTSEGTIITQPGVTLVDGTVTDRQVESYLTDVMIDADLIGTDDSAEDVS